MNTIRNIGGVIFGTLMSVASYLVMAVIGAFTFADISLFNPFEWHFIFRFILVALFVFLTIVGAWADIEDALSSKRNKKKEGG